MRVFNLTFIFLLLFAGQIFAQNQNASELIVSPPNPVSKDVLKQTLKDISDANVKYIKGTTEYYNLASKYTFRNIVKTDFSTVTIADNSASVGQFAALSIDPNSYKLAFSPYAWSPIGKDLTTKDFKNIYSINISATLSNKSLLNLKDWRTVSGSFSFTRLIGERYRFDDPDVKTKHTDDQWAAPYKAIYEALKSQMEAQYSQAYDATTYSILNKLTALNHPEFYDKTAIQQAYLDSISKYEQIMIKKAWTTKSFWWLKFTGTPLSFDNANYIVNNDASTYDSPKKATIWTPSFGVSINYFFGTIKHWNFYFNANAQLGQKDMFSGVYTPLTYNNYSKLTDTSQIQKSTSQIFRSNSADVSKRILPDFGTEFLFIKTFNNIGLGLDINYSYNFLISDKANTDNGYLSSPSIGLIVALKDKTGKSNINIEPYFQYQNYIDVTVASQRLWGLKFSVPINSLY